MNVSTLNRARTIEDQILDIEEAIKKAVNVVPMDAALIAKLGGDLASLKAENTTSERTNQSVDDRIIEIKRQIREAWSDEKKTDVLFDELNALTKQQKAVPEGEQDYSDLFELLLKAWIVPASMDKKILEKQLDEAKIRTSWSEKQPINKQSQVDIINQLKESLDEKDNTINELAMSKETLINYEFLRHRKLKKMYARIQKMKEKKDGGKTAVVYFMAMENRYTWWKIAAALNRWIMNMGFFNTEEVKQQMTTCLERYAEKPWDSEKTKTLKRLVYTQIKNTTNDYLDNVVKNNRIN